MNVSISRLDSAPQSPLSSPSSQGAKFPSSPSSPSSISSADEALEHLANLYERRRFLPREDPLPIKHSFIVRRQRRCSEPPSRDHRNKPASPGVELFDNANFLEGYLSARNDASDSSADDSSTACDLASLIKQLEPKSRKEQQKLRKADKRTLWIEAGRERKRAAEAKKQKNAERALQLEEERMIRDRETTLQLEKRQQQLKERREKQVQQLADLALIPDPVNMQQLVFEFREVAMPERIQLVNEVISSWTKQERYPDAIQRFRLIGGIFGINISAEGKNLEDRFVAEYLNQLFALSSPVNYDMLEELAKWEKKETGEPKLREEFERARQEALQMFRLACNSVYSTSFEQEL